MILAVLGRRDSPTDAVEDYCRLLGEAFKDLGSDFGLMRVAWTERGWLRALSDLWKSSANLKGGWALVQYTALMWSRHGFPSRFWIVLCALRIRRARTAVVFHDCQPYAGKRFRDRVRRFFQRIVMRWAYWLSDATILTVPLHLVSWLPTECSKASFITVGANIPAVGLSRIADCSGRVAKTISVFAVTDVGDISREVWEISLTARKVAECLPQVRLVTVGRGSAESESKFREALKGSSVEFSALGVLPAQKVSQVLTDSDVSLCVRYPMTTSRGSAIASIANGVPLVAYTDPILPGPLADAGIVGVPYLDGEKLAEATIRVLTDPQLWQDLHERSRGAYERHFSWEAVASRFLEILHQV